jgi:hypothetical protein
LAKQNKIYQKWWPRLTRDKAKNPMIQIDWERWIDEDEQDNYDE